MSRKQYEVVEQKFLNQKAIKSSVHFTSMSEYASDLGFYDSGNEQVKADIEHSVTRMKASQPTNSH